MMEWLWLVIGFLIVREIAAYVFDWDSSWFGETFQNAKYNRELYRSGRANKNERHKTIIGWRPDPYYQNDGFTADPGNKRIGKDGRCDTPSGEPEYYRVIRKRK